MIEAIIFDIDGTIANLTHRLPFLATKPKTWKKFYEKMVDDKPIPENIKILKALKKHFLIIFLTGRPENYIKQTTDWLEKQGINPQLLIMRNPKDFRASAEYKAEVYEKQIKGNFKILAVFEDETKTVEMWREKGIKCFQVEKWN